MLSFPNTETHSHQLPTSSDTACRSSRTFSLLLTEAKLQFGQQNVDESSTHPVITSSMLTRPRKTGTTPDTACRFAPFRVLPPARRGVDGSF